MEVENRAIDHKLNYAMSLIEGLLEQPDGIEKLAKNMIVTQTKLDSLREYCMEQVSKNKEGIAKEDKRANIVGLHNHLGKSEAYQDILNKIEAKEHDGR